MDDESSTFGLGTDQLYRLWRIGRGEKGDSTPEDDANLQKSELLHDKLAEKLPLEQAIAQVLPGLFAKLCETLKPFASDSIDALVLNPRTGVCTLIKIKEYYKRQTGQFADQTEHDVAAIIYYVVIASALVHHQQRITSFSYEHLTAKYRTFVQLPWLTSSVRELFEKALLYCERPTDLQGPIHAE